MTREQAVEAHNKVATLLPVIMGPWERHGMHLLVAGDEYYVADTYIPQLRIPICLQSMPSDDFAETVRAAMVDAARRLLAATEANETDVQYAFPAVITEGTKEEPDARPT